MYVKKFLYVCTMKKDKTLYVILKQRSIKIKVTEVLKDGRYRLIDGDVVGKEDIIKTVEE